jgi:hypothetical protein
VQDCRAAFWEFLSAADVNGRFEAAQQSGRGLSARTGRVSGNAHCFANTQQRPWLSARCLYA